MIEYLILFGWSLAATILLLFFHMFQNRIPYLKKWYRIWNLTVSKLPNNEKDGPWFLYKKKYIISYLYGSKGFKSNTFYSP